MALTCGRAPGELYEWAGGALSPVSVLPGAGHEQVAGRLGLGGSQAARGAISATARGSCGIPPQRSTCATWRAGKPLQLDEAEEVGGEPCEGCESGGGQFQFASADGSRVFFTDAHRLSEDSGAQAGKRPL